MANFHSAKNSEGTVEQNVEVGRKADDADYPEYDEDPDDELNECKYNPITKVRIPGVLKHPSKII